MSEEAKDRLEKLQALKSELEISRTNELLKLSGRGDGWVPDGVNVERAHSLHATIQIVDAAIRSENDRVPYSLDYVS